MIHSNLWKNDLIAIAYSYQQHARPYLELIKTTEHFIDARPDQIWLDLGCGSGRLLKCIWEKSLGRVHGIIGLDISRRSLLIAKRAVSRFQGDVPRGKIHFVQADLSKNLGGVRPGSVDGITAGLCLSYAEHWDDSQKSWNEVALESLFGEIYSVLKEGGSFIFSTNVPKPNFRLIALRSWRQILLTWKAPLYLAVSLVMLFQSQWLKRAAAMGRFHYLPAGEIVRYLERTGFKSITYQLTYAGQAWVFFAVKAQ